jgi:hypothetical protein
MDSYHIALFLHLLALVVAAGASAVTKLAAARRARARTVGDMLEWHGVIAATSRLFPICIVVFLVTGSYMLAVARVHAWSTGFVVAGMLGIALLLVNSVFLARQGIALRRMLEGMAAHGADQPAPRLTPPPVVGALPAVNSAVAIAVVFVMVTKPASVPLALGIVALGAVLGAVSAARQRAPRISTATIEGAASRQMAVSGDR